MKTIDIILHALIGIRAQIIAYHQMRAQSVVFISGLAVAMTGLTLAQTGTKWAWVALLGPMTFLGFALYLSAYFRQLLDVCQSVESSLLGELKAATADPGQPLVDNSAVYYDKSIHHVTDINGDPIRMKLWHDPTQHVLIVYMVFYLIFWIVWYKPWKTLPVAQ
jgi:hypothetical protein